MSTGKTTHRRFWEQITEGDNGCWKWCGTHYPHGYARFRFTVDGKRTSMVAHRYAYIELHGSVPDGLECDHLCRNRGCVNPSHLEPVTRQVNILRGVGITAQHAKRTHCQRGHQLIRPLGEPLRRCQECRKMNDAKRRLTAHYKITKARYRKASQQNPSVREGRRAYDREWKRKLRLDPIYRERQRQYQLAYRQKNKEAM